LSVKNLHSLINGKWFIDKPYGYSFAFPSLEGKDILLSLGNGNRIFYFKKIKTALVAAAGFDSGSNDNEYVAV
jgi:hypothetical protein